MTVNELYKVGLSLLPTNKEDDNNLEQYMIGWVNILLAEALPTENSIRESHGLEDLDTPPYVTTLNDTIPMDARIVNAAFPYGIAEHMSKDDNDSYWAQDFRARYISALNDCLKMNPEKIVDVYWGDGRCE